VSATRTAARMRPRPFIEDLVLTAITSAIVMASLIAVTGWMASGLGPVEFGAYALSRRLLSAITAFSTIPVGVAVARTLAITRSERERLACICAGVLYAFVPNLLIVVLGLVVPGFWARVLLSGDVYVPVLQATLVLLLGMTAYSTVYATFRGTGRMRRANVWQLWVMGLGPAVVAATWARKGSASLVVLLTGVVALTALVQVAGWLLRAARARVRWPDVRARLGELLRYGVPRLPGGIAFGGMLAVGPFLAPYVGDLRQAGYLVAGQSLLRVVEGGTAAFGLVALPRVASLRANNQVGFLRDRVEDVVAMALHLGLFACCQLALWSEEITTIWLGPGYEEAVPLVRILMLAVVPYLCYALLRSVIDGLEERAVNTQSMLVACAVTVVLSLALGLGGLGVFGLAVAGAVGFVALGGLSVRYVWRTLGLGAGHLAAGLAVGANLVAGLLAIGTRQWLREELHGLPLLAAGLGWSLALLAGYLAVLRRARVRWVLEIEQRLRTLGLGR